jgi:hypothetical protein
LARATVADPDPYEHDFVAWARAQAEALRARRFDALDLKRLAEEVEELGSGPRNTLRSRLRRIMSHLVKLEHSPAEAPRRGWEASVTEGRADIETVLTSTLRAEIGADLAALYQRARRDAERELRRYREDTAADDLPAGCPWDLDTLLGDWLPARHIPR